MFLKNGYSSEKYRINESGERGHEEMSNFHMGKVAYKIMGRRGK